MEGAWKDCGGSLGERWGYGGAPAVLRSEKVPVLEILAAPEMASFLPKRVVLDDCGQSAWRVSEWGASQSREYWLMFGVATVHSRLLKPSTVALKSCVNLHSTASGVERTILPLVRGPMTSIPTLRPLSA